MTAVPVRARTADTRALRAVGVLIGLVVAGTIAVLVLLGQGGRWFVVATPSMGTSAPVGALVITWPTPVDALHTGDIVSFHPPTSPTQTYTHRIIGITPLGAVTTRGDINGAADPWQLRGSDLVGRAVAVLPGVGWIARGLPLLLVGVVLVLALTGAVRSPTLRAELRIVGATLAFSVTAFVLRPFTGLQVLQTSVSDGLVHATVVSTGLLPIRVAAERGAAVDLRAGEVGQLTFPAALDGGRFSVSSALHLGLVGWIVFAVVCCLPLIWILVFGLPGQDASDEGGMS